MPDIKDIIAAGEGQAVEFKSRYPDQARDLAREIAAFATCNDGTIWIGVADDGGLIGLPSASTSQERDSWTKRIQGVSASIKPPVMVAVTFHKPVDGITVIQIAVPKGSAPLYYVNNVPYVRHLSASRPAEPQEVIDRILAWKEKGPSPETEFLTGLGGKLVEVLVQAGEAREDERDVTPQLDEIQYQLQSLSDDMRTASRRAPDGLAEIRDPLRALADQLEEAGHQHMSIGYGFDEYLTACDASTAQARAILDQWLPETSFSPEALKSLSEMAIEQVKAIDELAGRAETLAHGRRLKDLQDEAGRRGLMLLRLAAYGVGLGGEDQRRDITAAARRLRAAEVREVYLDGGASVAAIVTTIRDASARLTGLLPL